jgi:hypothetical protein
MCRSVSGPGNVWQHHDRRAADGTWDRLVTELSVDADAAGELNWVVAADSSINPAGTSTPPGPLASQRQVRRGHKGAASNDTDRLARYLRHGWGRVPRNPAPPCPGPFRGSFTSKLHLICDDRGMPLSIGLTSSNVNNTIMLGPALTEIRVLQRGPSRPRTQTDRLLGTSATPRPHAERSPADVRAPLTGP